MKTSALTSTVHNCLLSQRKLGLPNPTTWGVDIQPWSSLYEHQELLEERDKDLLVGATWFNHEIATLRGSLYEKISSEITHRDGVMLALATLNREVRVLMKRGIKAANKAAKEGVLAVDAVSNQVLQGPRGGHQGTADDFASHAVDAVEWWLYATPRLSSTETSIKDIDFLSKLSMQYFSLERGINFLWQDVLWLGWHLESKNGHRFFRPRYPSEEYLRNSWLHRHNARSFEARLHIIHAWKSILGNDPERVNRIELGIVRYSNKTGRKRQFHIGRLPHNPDSPSHYYLDIMSLEFSYLEPFLDAQLSDNGLTCRELAHAWDLLRQMSEILIKGAGTPPIRSFKEIRQWALLVKREELEDIFTKCLSINSDKCDELISFLTFEARKKKGLWGAPMVQIPGTNKYALAYPVLTIGNNIRRTEIWLEESGYGNDGNKSKGIDYEAKLRAKIAKGVLDNKLITLSMCAPNAIKKVGQDGEEIDLLLRFGRYLIVGEIKCFVFPTDPVDHFNYLKKIEGAAQQAVRKSDWLHQNPDVAAHELNMSVKDIGQLELLPMVIVNQGFGSSLVIDGCHITDADFFYNYVSGGSYGTGAYSSKDSLLIGETTQFYNSEEEAENRLLQMLEAPPVLTRYLDRTETYISSFPISNGDELHCEKYIIADIKGPERLKAETFKSAFD